ncbi:MAG: C39 family peptidase [Novosphingobium sp.]
MRGTLKGMAVAALIAAQASPGPALAEVRLSGEAGANYQIAVKSWWEIPFRSVVRQQYDFSCGSAAVATLLTYHYGRRTPEQFAFAKMWESGDQALIRKSGFSMLDMKNLLNSIGYKAEGFRMSYKALRAHRQPGIVLLDLRGYKHFVVVKGVTDKSVLVGDPMIGLSQYSHEDFAKIWNGIFLAVVAPPTSTPAKFNLASDWGPWATAPLEEGGLHVAVGDLTNNLPFGYQLSSQLLYDVRTGTISQ